MSRLLLLIILLAPGSLVAQGWPGAKPPPLGAPEAPAPAPWQGQQQGGTAQRCAPPLAAGCLRMQSSCQLACPPMWSTNPSAPAFTPNDRAGCMQRCLTQYLSCQRQYGC